MSSRRTGARRTVNQASRIAYAQLTKALSKLFGGSGMITADDRDSDDHAVLNDKVRLTMLRCSHRRLVRQPICSYTWLSPRFIGS